MLQPSGPSGRLADSSDAPWVADHPGQPGKSAKPGTWAVAAGAAAVPSGCGPSMRRVTEEAFLSATRAGYDTVAPGYAALVPSVADDHPLHRAILRTFAELVLAAGGGPVVDVGCGTGRVTGYLDSLGLDVSGVDLSPGMLAIARRNHPTVRFAEGSLLDLDLPDGGLAGLLAWYSIIHLPPPLLPAAFAGFHRVLSPGGLLQVAFHVGDEKRHLTQAYGHDGISMDSYRLPVDVVRDGLVGAGFAVDTEILRQPDDSPAARAPQAYLLFRRD